MFERERKMAKETGYVGEMLGRGDLHRASLTLALSRRERGVAWMISRVAERSCGESDF
ncbi:MAG: hypothetical protein M1551_09345 [Firmicutes bacterium]|nr:hypothetical protein [Bacillota bacterium]